MEGGRRRNLRDSAHTREAALLTPSAEGSTPSARCAGEVLRVAGPTFRADAVHHAASHGGDDVRVVPEPTNAADTNARKVVVSGSHVGYLPRGCALSSGPVRLLCVGTAPVPHCWLFVGA